MGDEEVGRTLTSVSGRKLTVVELTVGVQNPEDVGAKLCPERCGSGHLSKRHCATDLQTPEVNAEYDSSYQI